MQITKNATDNSKNNYKGYGICFDERSEYGHTLTEDGFTHTTDARNVLIFGADMSFSVHATNRVNNIYVMGAGLTQGINDTTIYAEKNFYRNFTDFGKKFMVSLNESEKTVVDYEQISGVKAIYDMHMYLMTKHNISP